MSAWEELAQQRKPAATPADIGKGLENFLNKQIGSLCALKTLFCLTEVSPNPLRAGELAGKLAEKKTDVVAALEHLVAHVLAERRRGLLGSSYRYLRDNPHSMTIHNLRKLWKHPRTHNLLMYKIVEADKALRAK